MFSTYASRPLLPLLFNWGCFATEACVKENLLVIAASAILVRTIRTAFPAAFAVAVLDLAHALVRVLFQ